MMFGEKIRQIQENAARYCELLDQARGPDLVGRLGALPPHLLDVVCGAEERLASFFATLSEEERRRIAPGYANSQLISEQLDRLMQIAPTEGRADPAYTAGQHLRELFERTELGCGCGDQGSTEQRLGAAEREIARLRRVVADQRKLIDRCELRGTPDNLTLQ